jgi:molecular chaperone DnaK
MFQVGKSMEDLEGKITEEEKTEINSAVDKLKTAYNNKEISEVKVLMEEVNNKFQTISQKLYEQTNNDEVTEEDFSNVEFEEVK